ncbi:MAG: FtsH protease activity modulator HflK [Planctomycetota bacterium]|jgi:membrane protease subunit HflK
MAHYDDFDFDQSLNRLRNEMPRVPWLPVVIVALLAIAGFSSYFTVEAEGKGVVKRFGRVVAIREPGLHFKLPFGIDRVTFVPTEIVHKEEFGFRTAQAGQQTLYDRTRSYQDESLMLTGDLNVIDVEWVIQYKIDDPDKWLHRVRDPIEGLRDVSESVMRQIVGNREGSDVLTVGRVGIADLAAQEMQAILDTYDLGMRITTIEMQDVTPPDEVKNSFNEVNKSRQEKEQSINIAEKQRNEIIPRAMGQAKQTIAEAEGDALEMVNRAKGEAARFTALLEEYQRAPELTRQRLLLEMAENVLPAAGKVYVTDDDANSSPVPLLHLDAGQPNPLQSKGGAR